MRIGSRTLRNNLFVAPMAGVTDRPFRQLCKQFGAGLAVSEMVASNSLLWGSEKTRRRANHDGEVEPISVQIAGADPVMMADAARYNVEQGAQIIDINMGCPAKKVCNTMAGSALLRDEPLVGQILESVGESGGCTGHPEVPHWLGHFPQERAQGCEDRGGQRRTAAVSARPHARLRLLGPSRVRHDSRSQAVYAPARGGERRYQDA